VLARSIMSCDVDIWHSGSSRFKSEGCSSKFLARIGVRIRIMA